MATKTIPLADQTTNRTGYVRYLETAVCYLDLQLERASQEIAGLRADLARLRGENLRSLGVAR